MWQEGVLGGRARSVCAADRALADTEAISSTVVTKERPNRSSSSVQVRAKLSAALDP